METHFLSPGDPRHLTGGHIYNRRMLDALARRKCPMNHHVLAGDFPDADDRALAEARHCLAGLPDGALVVIDGLALGGMSGIVTAEAERLRLVALVHLPLGAETGQGYERLRRRSLAEAQALTACRRIIANSAHTREHLVLRGFDRARIDVVTPGTEPAGLARGSGRAPVLVQVASLIPRKGQDLLVDALAGLTDLDWHCRLVGSLERDPGFVDSIRARIGERQLAARVELTGEASGATLEAFWGGADIAVLASRYEGFGMVVTEAAARGLPVVASAGGAVAEALPEGAGLLVAPGDVTALRAALFDVISSAELRATLAAGARRARPALATWDDSAARFEAALHRAAVA